LDRKFIDVKNFYFSEGMEVLMAETSVIAEVASIVSKDIFKWLKWDARPLKDSNWACVVGTHKTKIGTHPSDVVFHYTDPYTGEVIYINTDLKSYAKGTINDKKVLSALMSLSDSVECANISSDWKNKYLLDESEDNNVIGMLFIYNHDNEYFGDFGKLIEKVNPSSLKIAKGNRIVVFGPEKIRYLYNIVTDIKMLKSEDFFMSINDYTFYYPDLVLFKRHGDEWGQPASIEALTAPWLMLKYRSKLELGKNGYVIYYNRKGSTVEEFVYLFDALSHYQMLLSDQKIDIKLVDASENALENINKAKHRYLMDWSFDGFRKTQIEKVNAAHMKNFVNEFKLQEVGMRNEK
jgi:hypothetical protein